jgi:hypothetical protein
MCEVVKEIYQTDSSYAAQCGDSTNSTPKWRDSVPWPQTHTVQTGTHTYTLLEAVSHRGGSWRRSRVQHTVYVFGRLYQQIVATPDAHNTFRRIGLWRHFMHFALELTRITTASNMIS